MKLRTMVVDDERPALEELMELLGESKWVGEVNGYSQPQEALKHLGESPADIVFLDIQMPGMTGLQVAERLLPLSKSEVVFVTAYNQYALPAFDLCAVDYLLKPVSPERLNKTLERIWRRRKSTISIAPQRHTPQLCCFGTMQFIGYSGKVKWKIAKAHEMFAYLYLNREASPERIVLDLFSDWDRGKARTYVHTCIYQLRKSFADASLSDQITIALRHRNYYMDIKGIESDLQHFERLLAIPEKNRELLIEAASLYRGPLFQGIDSLWIVERREYYSRQYYRVMEELIELLMAEGRNEQALAYARKIQFMEPFDEKLGLRCIEIHMALGQKHRAVQFFEQFLRNYQKELGNPLSPQIIERCKALLHEAGG